MIDLYRKNAFSHPALASRSARGIYAFSAGSTSSTTTARATTRDSTTSSCTDRHHRSARTPMFDGISAWEAFSVSVLEKPDEWPAH